jgi:hypothetical protein
LKSAIQNREAAAERAASLRDAAVRGDGQLKTIDAELSELASVEDDIAAAEAAAIQRGREFRLPPKLGDALDRRKFLQDRRGAVARAAEKLHADLNSAEATLRLVEAAAVDAQKPLLIAESELIAAESENLRRDGRTPECGCRPSPTPPFRGRAGLCTSRPAPWPSFERRP